jgi:N-glycosylase/DNA lyase
MKFLIDNNDILIKKNDFFDIKQILECGQIFRYFKKEYGYDVLSLDKVARVYIEKDKYVIKTNDANYFVNFFDLYSDYSVIYNKLLSYGDIMKKSCNFGKGIRILRQDSFEMLLSFIISSNNMIPRIQKSINMICKNIGKKIDDEYYAFPALSDLKDKDETFFRQCGVGFRDKYLVKTIKELSCGFDLTKINQLSTSDAIDYLCNLYGVGNKVANCILLFGYHREDVFPVDTWMKKVYIDYFNGDKNLKAEKISSLMIDKFKNLSGYAQQYLFYYKRELEK